MKDVSPDARLRVIATLLIPAFVGHFIQLLSEDTPWAPHARVRAWVQPGWHQYLPTWLPWVIFVLLGLLVIGLAVRRRRAWLAAVVLCYVAHYVTYPYRIRNHMTFMLAQLVMLGGVWWLGRRGDRREVDSFAMIGAAVVSCITYFFAALHKVNDTFLSLGPDSSAVQGLTTFWIYGDLGSDPPWIAKAIACYGTVAVEALVPIVAWRSAALRPIAILVLFAFHFPHVAVMDVADYPMIASTFYPAFFGATEFERVREALARPNGWSVGGAAIGVGLQLWFMPWWGGLTGFGIMVMALWGYASGVILRTLVARGRARAVAVG